MNKELSNLRGRHGGMCFLLLLTVAVMLVAARGDAQSAVQPCRLTGHVPAASFVQSRLGAVSPAELIPLALSLPQRNQAALQEYLRRVADRNDPLYGRYLTPAQFWEQYSPTEAQYAAVEAFARASGLTVTGRHANRLLLNVTGTTASVEQVFSTQLARFQAKNGRVFRAPAVEPSIPAAVAGIVSDVIGLDTLAVRRHHAVTPSSGTGPSGGLAPSDIRTAYNLNGLSWNGSGQSVALFQLDGYDNSDIAAYEDQFSLPHVPLQNILVDGVSGSSGSAADEVTLDIELTAALAPGLGKILVYEGPNTDVGVLDLFTRIADDNLASVVSISWGATENEISAATLQAENTLFQQMAAQGQSVFAASGDSGAYDNGSTLSVDDPASQPYVTGVGGTTLQTNGAGGAWVGESAWNGGSASKGAGGGGISSVWTLPSYQSGVVSTANKGSTSRRNVPDVALDSDPNSGYSIYYNGDWWIYGGTSCAAPLWAAYTALVNQARAAGNMSRVGFLNPTLYEIGKGTRGKVDFRDVADGTTNLYYPTVTGYDLATGWGTLNGLNLLAELADSSTTSSYSISGTIAVNGTGLSGVTVTAGDVSTTTDSSGSYALAGLAAATYTVTPSKSAYTFSPTTRSVTVSTADVTGIDFAATADTVTYSIGGTITVDGSGLSGVTVSAGGKSTTTSSTGTYTVSGLSAGTYTVTPSKSGYAFSPPRRSVQLLGASATGVNFTGTAAATYGISGTVTAGGSPLSGVTVSAGSVSTTTGSTGTYTLSGFKAGTYTVTPSKSGYTFSPTSRSVAVNSANVSGANFTGTALAATYSISGTVLLGSSGLSGVTITGGGKTTTTSSSGTYTLSGLAAGSYTVTASREGYSFTPSTRSLTLSANATNQNFTAQAVTTLISVSVSKSAVKGRKSVIGTVLFNRKVTAATTVTLTSSNTSAARVPSSVRVKKGAKKGTFTITTRKVSARTTVAITARSGSSTKTAQLAVKP